MVNQAEERNLYQLFKAISSIEGVEYFEDQLTGFSYIKNNGFEWPNMSFIQIRENSHIDFNFLVDKIKTHCFPRLFIFNQAMVNNMALGEQLSLNKFVVAGQWVNMYLELRNFNPQISGGNFVEVRDYEMVCSWSEVVSQSLFKGKILDAGVFHKGIEAGIFRLFAKILDNRIIATSLVFISHPDDSGIYMVSTHPNHRKQGFGYEIMNFTLSEIKKQGCERAVLQSTNEGLALYSKLGFVQNSLLPIYFCLIR